ncbi:enoyl-CoA hydratase [Kordiimonas sediminis]|uniref:Enoyl-CoA hydratase n=1 Tax=Kordiimonas sediminis TaxID=1735581 RepID=A0A919AWN7_9PROT|nr:enoyl-CoA hydratase/isomerase family protein [Kordiimonas sediminis]GHF26936.1 enoyl-CoA hydratase [Kordiimonas sediminis]
MLEISKSPEGIARIRLNRPEVHNAFNAELIAQLHAAFVQLGTDNDVRAIILSGNGKSFSAGADLSWMKDAATFTHAENLEDAEKLSAMLNSIYTCPKPVLALVHGAAMGGGVGLTACADIVLCVEGAKFALSEVRLGLTPATISPFVVAAIGERQARRLFITAERFDATTAKDIGLVHEVYQTLDDAEEAMSNILQDILAGGPHAIADAKHLVLSVSGKPIDAGLRSFTAEQIATRRTSQEGQEGLAAFFEKRSPDWILKS